VYGVSRTEPGLVAAVLAVTILVSLVSAGLAARRALAIQPIEAMRGG
jgi:ABC-type lipoprotein release transport system permease subunit